MKQVLLAALVAAFGLAGLQAEAQEIKLRANTIGAPGGIQEATLLKFKEVAEEKSGGRVSVAIFTGAALGDQDANLEALQSGTLDVATIETPITQVDPLLGVLALPYMFQDRAHVAAVLEGAIGEALRQRLLEQDLVVVGYYEAGFRQITNNVRPIVTPADLKGVKMRTPGSKLRIKIFETWGANASPLPFAELYTALQTGAFDGQENPLVEVKASRFYEVQTYLSITNHIYQPGFLLMSKQVFDGLPQELQAAMLEAGMEGGRASVAFGEAADGEVIELAKSKGMEVNEADIAAFQAASKAIWEEELADLGEEAASLVEQIQAAGK